MNLLQTFLFKLPHFSSSQIAMQVSRNDDLETVTYAELKERSLTAAEHFKKVGVKPGHRVLLITENCPEAMVAFLATLQCGAIAVFIDPQLPRMDLQTLIHFTDSAIILVSEHYAAEIKTLDIALPLYSIENPFSAYSGAKNDIPPPDAREDTEVAAILFTSGTTGQSKGVMLSHQNFIQGILKSHTVVKSTPKDTMLNLLPIHHISPLLQNLLCFYTGTTLTLVPNPDSANIANTFQTTKPTIIGIVPLLLELFNKKIGDEIKKQSPIAQSMVQSLSTLSYKVNQLTSLNVGRAFFKKIQRAFGGRLKRIICGGAAANANTLKQLRSFGFTIIEAYGLSETTGPICSNRDNQFCDGTVGLPFSGINIRLENTDANGNGEICIQGDMVMKGYFRDPEASARALQAGWLHTGDIGQFNKDGMLKITGRLREIIVLPSGKKAIPTDVESKYQNIPGIKELAVFGMPDSKTGAEHIHAAVVLDLKMEALPDIENLIHDRAKHLPPHFQIQCIHILEDLPKTAMLKIKRSLLPQFIKTSSRTKTFSHAPEENTPTDISHWISAWIANKTALSLSEIDPTKSFIYYNLDSLSITQLCEELGQHLNTDVHPALIWEHASISKLSAYLGNRSKTDSPITPNAAQPTSNVHDPIVVVGMACRFPGNVVSPESFWELLSAGKTGISEIPQERWNKEAYYDANPDAPGKTNGLWGGFINDIDKFDQRFFEISPLEAENIDPQHRLLLELSWEALEYSNINPDSLAGTSTGVYIGISTTDYNVLQITQRQLNMNAYSGIGNIPSAASGRIAYFLGLQGIAKTIDTACSSSLVAIHDACQDLQAGLTSMAIVGGANAILTPLLNIALSKAKMLSPDGTCHVFDEKANGYVRSEGCGVVILKRLSDAKKDGNTILATIAAAGINQDGRSNGLTAPNGEAQVQLFHSVLQKANLAAHQINYIETHGTGTPLGDPIEVRSINTVYGKNRSEQDPLYIGSVKSSIGHLEAAAGMAGFIKAILMLQHKKIPQQLHFTRLNPLITLENLAIPTTLLNWENSDTVRHAAVNAFGFTGTNAQIILKEAPSVQPTEASSNKPYYLFTLSAKSEESLKKRVQDLSEWLELHPNVTPDALSFTLNTGRAALKKRCAFICHSISELKKQLSQYSSSVIDKSSHSSDEYYNELKKLAALYLAGNLIPWDTFYTLKNTHTFTLPVYKFQKERHWTTNATLIPFRNKSSSGTLLEKEIVVPPSEQCFEIQIDLSHPDQHYLKGHKVYGEIIYPAAAFIDLLLQAGEKIYPGYSFALSNLTIESPLMLEIQKPVSLFVAINSNDKAKSIRVCKRTQDQWLTLAQGMIIPTVHFNDETKNITELQSSLSLEQGNPYSEFDRLGLNYEGTFQCIKQLWHRDNEILALIETPSPTQHPAFPALLDGCFQALATVMFSHLNQNEVYLPIKVEKIQLNQPLPNSIFIHGTSTSSGNVQTGHFHILDKTGRLIAKIENAIAIKTHQAAFYKALSSDKENHLLYSLAWKKDNNNIHSLPARENKDWLIIRDKECLIADELSTLLENHEHRVTSVTPNHLSKVTSDAANIIYFGYDPASLLSVLQKPPSDTAKLWVISTGAHSTHGEVPSGFNQGISWGIKKCLSFENPKLRFFCVDLDPEIIASANAALLFNELWSSDNEDMVALRQEGRFLPRLSATHLTSSELKTPTQGYYQLRPGNTKLIDDVYFETTEQRELADDEIEIDIKAMGLNFRDTLIAMGLYPGNPPIGADCAGIITRTGSSVSHLQSGDAVFGMVSGCIANRMITKAIHVSPKPENLSFSEAATLPIVFLTAYYALHHVISIQKGQRILIHTASGGLGLACIQLAKLAGAEIFTTAGTPEKRAYLQSLGIKHIYDSRTLEYAKYILEDTQGQGVDIVINTLTGKDYIATTLSACNKNAHFIEMSKRDIWSEEKMQSERSDIHYHIIALDTLAETNPVFIQKIYQEIASLFTSRSLLPIPYKTYPIGNVKSALHEMRKAKHIGKLVLINDPSPSTFNNTDLNIITGGAGELGLTITDWMLAQGAQNILLVNRRPPAPAAQEQIAALRKNYPQANIILHEADIANDEQVRSLFSHLKKSNFKIHGIIHAAGVLEDGLIANQTVEKFQKVFSPKVDGAWNLHQATKNLNINYFVMFSSSAALLGSPGQANYAAANTYLDQLAHYRRSQGLSAQSINWGAWTKLGMAKHLELNDRFGIRTIDLQDALTSFATILKHPNHTQVAVLSMDWSKYLSWTNQAFLSEIVTHKPSSSSTQNVIPLTALLSNASADQREHIIKNYLKSLLVQLLKLHESDPIEDHTLLADLGMDSLTAMEFVSLIHRDTNNNQLFSGGFSFENTTIHTIYQEMMNLYEAPQVEQKPAIQLSDEDLQQIENRAKNLFDTGFKNRLLHRVIRPIFLFLCKFYFRVSVKGLENLPQDKPFILCANHTSSLDGLILLLASKSYPHGMVTLIAENHFYKNETLLALSGDAIPFDRDHTEYAFLKNNTYIKLFKEKQKSFILFPEGTRSIDGKIQEFKHGVSWFAHHEELPVIPAYIQGAFEALPKNHSLPFPRKITVTIGKPLTPTGVKNKTGDNIVIYQHFTQSLRESIISLSESF